MSRNNSFNISRLSKYNFKYISIEEVIILEYLMHYYQKNNLELVVQSRIELETGLKRNKIIYASDELVAKGFLSMETKSKRICYSIHLEAIVASLSKLFLNSNKPSLQYFYYVQNPNMFKKSKKKIQPKVVVVDQQKTPVKKAAAAKPKEPVKPIQTSLF